MSHPMLYADNQSYPAIMKWGLNTEAIWFHPLTENQYTKFEHVKEGDRLILLLNKKPHDVIVLGKPSEEDYTRYKALYGPFDIPRWDFTHIIYVKRA